jgi:hypothetical protein
MNLNSAVFTVSLLFHGRRLIRNSRRRLTAYNPAAGEIQRMRTKLTELDSLL